VVAHTFAALQRFDAGFRFTPDGGRSHPFRDRGVTIPSLDQLLTAFPRARINVEVKHERAAERVWETIHAHGATRRVLVAASERANRRRFGEYPGPVSASREEILAFWLAHKARAPRAYAPPVDALQVPEHSGGLRVVSPRFVQDAHRCNLPVHVWTVNARADMERLLDWGVDALISDRPDTLAGVLHRLRGRTLPPGPPPGAAEPFLERLLRP
jgi:glycerophosphoryl diester phosphodiesterase